MIATRAQGARVLFVGTRMDDDVFKGPDGAKIKQRLDDKLSAVAARAVANGDVAFVSSRVFLVDALHGTTNNDELLSTIIRAGVDVVKTRSAVPASLLKLQRVLRKHAVHHKVMSKEDFTQLCFSTTGASVALLPRVLKEWGWIEHFYDTPNLSNCVFLDPQWVAKMMAAVVKRVGVRPSGEVSILQMADAWKRKGASSELIPQLVLVRSSMFIVVTSVIDPPSPPFFRSRLWLHSTSRTR
jgi:C-terminal of Roc, COR, domain